MLATLSLDKKVAAPGDVVNASGRNWSSAASASPVTIKLRTRDGQTLATTAADSGGRISTPVNLPANLSPGWYVVVATQFNANGTPKIGSPGRTTLRIQGTAKSADVAGAPWSSKPEGPSASAAPADGSGAPLLALLLAGTLSLAMLTSGWKLLSRKARGVGQPLGI